MITKNSPNVLTNLGLNQEDILMHNSSSSVFKPAFQIIHDKPNETLYLNVRGTLTANDLITDVIAIPVPYLDGYSHQGIAKSCDWLIDEVKSTLVDHFMKNPNDKLIFCGHSLGVSLFIYLSVLFVSIKK